MTSASVRRLQSAAWRVFVLTGDGELQEGPVWEAVMYAGQIVETGPTRALFAAAFNLETSNEGVVAQ